MITVTIVLPACLSCMIGSKEVIYSVNIYVMSTYCVTGTVLGSFHPKIFIFYVCLLG